MNYAGGYQFSITGPLSAPNSRELVIAKTRVTLNFGVQYCLSYYISLADTFNCAVNRSDAYFSPTPMDPTLNTPPYLTYTQPQVMADSTIFYNDKVNWMRIEGAYTAAGGENYITIGNLHLDNPTDTLCSGIYPPDSSVYIAYYYMDNFSLEEIKPVNAGAAISITSGDSVIIGNNLDSASSYSWSPNYFINDTNAVNPIVNPPVTTTYYVTKTQCSVTTTDTVTVFVAPLGIADFGNKHQFILYPNPNNSSFKLTHNLPLENYVYVEVMDLTGKVLYNEVMNSSTQDIMMNNLQTGLYFVNIKSDVGELMYSTKMSVNN